MIWKYMYATKLYVYQGTTHINNDLIMGGGGATEVIILYPKKSQLHVQNLSTQKNLYLF